MNTILTSDIGQLPQDVLNIIYSYLPSISNKELTYALRQVNKATYGIILAIAVKWFDKFDIRSMRNKCERLYFKSYILTINYPFEHEKIKIAYDPEALCKKCREYSLLFRYNGKCYVCLDCGSFCLNRNCDGFKVKLPGSQNWCDLCDIPTYPITIDNKSDSFCMQEDLDNSEETMCVSSEGNIAKHACKKCRNAYNRDMEF